MSLVQKYQACKTEDDLKAFFFSLATDYYPDSDEALALAEHILNAKGPLGETDQEIAAILLGNACDTSQTKETLDRVLTLAEKFLKAGREPQNGKYAFACLPGAIASSFDLPLSYTPRLLSYLEEAALSSSPETCLGVLESLPQIAQQNTPPEEKERFFGIIETILQKEWDIAEAFPIADTAKDCLKSLIKTFDCAPYRERIESIANIIDLYGVEYPALTESDPSSGIQVCAILSHKEAVRTLGQRLPSSASSLVLDDGLEPVENLAAFLTDPAADLLSSPSGLKTPSHAQAQKAFREAQKQAAQAQTRKIKQHRPPSRQMIPSPRSALHHKKP